MSGNGGGHVGGVKSCNCDTAEGPEAGGVALMVLFMAIAVSRRARRETVPVRIRRR